MTAARSRQIEPKPLADQESDLFGAYTALITPFSPDAETVDIARLRTQIEQQAAGGIRGIVPCGTTGETPTLTEKEYQRVVTTAIEHGHAHKLQVIPGAGSNNTVKAIEMNRFVSQSGADAALHVTPYYNKPSQEGLYRHFMAIADSADLRCILYHIPGRTGVAMTIDTFQRLAEHPNIVAVKDAAGDPIITSQLAHESSLTILSGDDPLTLPMMAVGARGVISVAGNIVPHAVSMYVKLALDGHFTEARKVHDHLLSLSRGLLSLDVNPVPIKTAMSMLDRDNGALRLPLVAMDEAAKQQLGYLLAGVSGLVGDAVVAEQSI